MFVSEGIWEDKSKFVPFVGTANLLSLDGWGNSEKVFFSKSIKTLLFK